MYKLVLARVTSAQTSVSTKLSRMCAVYNKFLTKQTSRYDRQYYERQQRGKISLAICTGSKGLLVSLLKTVYIFVLQMKVILCLIPKDLHLMSISGSSVAKLPASGFESFVCEDNGNSISGDLHDRHYFCLEHTTII